MLPVNIGDIIIYNGKDKGMVIGFGWSNPNTPQRRQYAIVRMLNNGKDKKVHFCRIGHEWRKGY
jgi:hypothetical protein